MASWQIPSQSVFDQPNRDLILKHLFSSLMKLEICITRHSAVLSSGSGHGQIRIAKDSTIVHGGAHTTSLFFYCEVVEPSFFLSLVISQVKAFLSLFNHLLSSNRDQLRWRTTFLPPLVVSLITTAHLRSTSTCYKCCCCQPQGHSRLGKVEDEAAHVHPHHCHRLLSLGHLGHHLPPGVPAQGSDQGGKVRGALQASEG